MLFFYSGSQTQSQRLKAMDKLKSFKCRILISTDLVSEVKTTQIVVMRTRLNSRLKSSKAFVCNIPQKFLFLKKIASCNMSLLINNYYSSAKTRSLSLAVDKKVLYIIVESSKSVVSRINYIIKY